MKTNRKNQLEKEISAINKFIEIPKPQFSGAVFNAPSSIFSFDISDTKDLKDDCYNIEITSFDEIKYILEKLPIEKLTLKQVLKDHKDSFKENKKYLIVQRNF